MEMKIFLGIHAAVCLVLVILCYFNRLHNMHRFLIPACLVPVFGPACLLAGYFNTRTDLDRKMTEAEEAALLDEVYHSITYQNSDNMDSIVPIEEAMLMNEPSVRRRIMLDVLYAGSDDLVRPIQIAGTNDDTEVVHFAVTALVELRKSYNLRIQMLNQRMEETQGDLRTVDDFIRLDEEYLASGLLDPEHKRKQLRHYRRLLERRNALKPDRLDTLRRMAAADASLGDRASERAVTGRLLRLFPGHEAGYVAMLHLAAAEQDTAALGEALRLIREKNIYITPENRPFVDYWMGKEQDRGENHEEMDAGEKVPLLCLDPGSLSAAAGSAPG